MKVKVLWTALLALIFTVSASAQSEGKLEEILYQSGDSLLQAVMRQPLLYQLQLRYSPVVQGQDGRFQLVDYNYNLDSSLYFYPAATVQLPLAILALEKLRDLKVAGLDMQTPMRVGEAAVALQMHNQDDSTHTSVARCIEQMFKEDDQAAGESLYALLGQFTIHRRLRRLGYDGLRILHAPQADEWGDKAGALPASVSFWSGDSLLYYQGAAQDLHPPALALKEQLRGVAYIDSRGGRRVKPFDFREKNFIRLSHLHDMMKAVFWPEHLPEAQRFRLDSEDYDWLREQLSGPGNGQITLPAGTRIQGVLAQGYGFLTLTAYVSGTDGRKGFLMSASLQLNHNQVYADGQYEYQSVGLPVLATIIRLLYERTAGR